MVLSQDSMLFMCWLCCNTPWLGFNSLTVNYNWTTDSLEFHTDFWKNRESLIDDGNVLGIAGMDWIWYLQWSPNISALSLYRILVFDVMGWSALDSSEMLGIPWNCLWNVVDSDGFRCGNICFVEHSIETGLKFYHIGIHNISETIPGNT